MTTEASAIYSSLFQHSQVNAILQLDTAGFVTAVNPAFTHYFGYTHEDVAGKHFSLFFTEADRLKKKPENEVATVLRTTQCDDKNFFVHKDGSVTWVSGESILITHEDGKRSLLKMIQDIQVQKDAEGSLTRANDLNETILGTIEDFVILLDKAFHVIKYNHRFAQVFGNRELLPVPDFAALIRQHDKNETLQHRMAETISTGKPFSKHEIEIAAADGERVFDISCQRVDMRDLGHAVLIVGRDISVQKRADVEREDLMGFVAHELRNPLASIKMGNELMGVLLGDGQPAALSDLLERNSRNIERLNNMVTQLYHAAKIGGGSFEVTMAPYDFDGMVSEAVETFRVLEPSHHFTIEGKTSLTVQGDRARMIQVLSNYIANSVKYSNGSPDIIIKVETDERNVVLSVIDHGAGIPSDQLPYLFDRFFRAEKTRNLEGIGLGLYLCRRIVDAHHGKVWAESEPGKGSIFYCSVPV